MAAQPGYVLAGRFRLDQEIGRAEHGVVFRATELESGRPIAVKVLYPSVAFQQGDAQRIAADAAVLADSGATSFVPVLACEVDEHGVVHVVMELCEGEPLDRHIADIEEFGDRAGPTKVIDLLAPIAETLGRAHGQGLVHADVKPSNVFLLDADSVIKENQRGGGVRLTDFGIARTRAFDVTLDPRVILGSASYVAPEVFWGARADARSDQYAFASVIYRMLAGQTPFPARSTLELYDKVTSAPRPQLTALRPELHPAIDAWASEALAIEPGRRYPTVQAMWRDFVASLLKNNAPNLARFRPPA